MINIVTFNFSHYSSHSDIIVFSNQLPCLLVTFAFLVSLNLNNFSSLYFYIHIGIPQNILYPNGLILPVSYNEKISPKKRKIKFPNMKKHLQKGYSEHKITELNFRWKVGLIKAELGEKAGAWVTADSSHWSLASPLLCWRLVLCLWNSLELNGELD